MTDIITMMIENPGSTFCVLGGAAPLGLGIAWALTGLGNGISNIVRGPKESSFAKAFRESFQEERAKKNSTKDRTLH